MTEKQQKLEIDFDREVGQLMRARRSARTMMPSIPIPILEETDHLKGRGQFLVSVYLKKVGNRTVMIVKLPTEDEINGKKKH